MNRLWVRLTLAFMLVTLIGVSAVAILADVNTTREFRQYVMHQTNMAQGGLADDLAAYYQQHGGWEGVGDYLDEVAAPMGRGRGMMRGHAPLVLADAGGRILYGEGSAAPGGMLTNDDLASAAPIRVNGSTVGYLLLTTAGMSSAASPEQAFLDQLHVTLVIAALIAAGASLVLGVLLSRALARPLLQVAAAARAYGQHQWQPRASVGGRTAIKELTDVSQAMNQMADSLQQSETLRRSMIADITHELRTPLTVLQGNLQAMTEGVYPLDQSELAILSDQTRLLNRLVDDLHELALVEAGQLPLNVMPVDAAPLLDAMAARFAGAASAKGITLRVMAAPQLPLVHADPDRLEEILQNLLSNALRHTPSGGQISLRGEVGEGGAGRVVRLCVADSGEGIAPEDLPHVFDRFYRGDRSRARQSGGSGLGLSIARTLAEAMGGTLRVESQLGKGSTFQLMLPCDGAEATARDAGLTAACAAGTR